MEFPLKAFTIGTFKVQRKGVVTKDGLGAAFQANVLTPWFMVQELLPQLSNGGRVIWISSSISTREYLSLDDLELRKCALPYEASKFELDALHSATYKQLYESHGIQSWLTQPGLFKSTTIVPKINFLAYIGMMIMFYICRWFGSPYHCIYPSIASNSGVWVALVARSNC